MIIYLVLSAFTSSPICLLATTKAPVFTFIVSAFSFTVCMLPPHKTEADVYHLISSDPGLPEIPYGIL